MSDAPQANTLRGLIPWRSGTLHVILAMSLIGAMGVTLISPVLPELRPVFGVSDAEVGLIITAYTLPGIFLTPVIGLLADRIGRKRVLVPLLFTFGMAGSAIAFTTDFTLVLVLRFLQGIGSTALVMLSITLIGDIYEGNQRDALIGINGGLIGAGAALFPFIGGWLAVLGWYAPFLFFGVAVLVGVLVLGVLQEPERGGAVGVRMYVGRITTVMRLPSAIAIFVAMFSAFFIFYGVVITALPLLLSDEFGLRSNQIGPILAAVSLASAIVSSQYGWISELRSASELAALGFVSLGCSLVLVWIAPSAVLVSVALLVFGVGFGILMPSIDKASITLVSSDLRAGLMGMRTSFLRLGQTLGPVAFTVAAERFFPVTVEGYRVLILLAGIFVIAGGSVTYLGVQRVG